MKRHYAQHELYKKTSSLLTTQINGRKILIGGQFGPEGSIQAVLICLITPISNIMQLYKQNNKTFLVIDCNFSKVPKTAQE